MWRPGGQADKSDNSQKKHRPKYWAQHADKSHQKKNKRELFKFIVYLLISSLLGI